LRRDRDLILRQLIKRRIVRISAYFLLEQCANVQSFC